MSNLLDIRPGQVFGRYEFLAPIAQGGMAAVWAARQRGSRGFSKIVAIKTMLPTISEDPRFERMFLDEARIASRIRHHHVVEILDLGEQDAMLYLVMEWVDGESLSTIRRAASTQGGIPVAAAVRIVADVCSGLHAAHELQDDEGQAIGLVHRDVSPQNILVGYDGVAKVTDFGVAKVAGRTSETTGAGKARGKPPYMAPEQAMGNALDRRADIFSLGIVLYQLVAERHPFRGENDIATLHNIISEQPIVSPRAFVPSISTGLESVIMRALERDPNKRMQTAREMELSLESLLDHELGRVRAEDIGKLISTWVGRRGEERRSTLREAIRKADAIAGNKSDGTLAELASSPRATPLSRRAEQSAPDASPWSSSHDPVASGGDSIVTMLERTSPSPIGKRNHEPLHHAERAGESELDELTEMDVTRAWANDGHLRTATSPNIPVTAGNAYRRRPLLWWGLLVTAIVCSIAVGTLVTFRDKNPSTTISRESASTTSAPPIQTTVYADRPDSSSTPVAEESHHASFPTASALSFPAATPTAEPKTTRHKKPPQVLPRATSTGPGYALPPISSPGF